MSTIAEELSRIKALASSATSDPWAAPPEYDDGHDIYAGGTLVAGNYDYEEGGIANRIDRDFVIDARTTIPRLVAAVEYAMTTIDGLSMTSDTGERREKWTAKRESELLAILRGEKP